MNVPDALVEALEANPETNIKIATADDLRAALEIVTLGARSTALSGAAQEACLYAANSIARAIAEESRE